MDVRQGALDMTHPRGIEGCLNSPDRNNGAFTFIFIIRILNSGFSAHSYGELTE